MPLVPCFALLRHGRSENDERGIFHGNGTDETACGAAAGFAARLGMAGGAAHKGAMVFYRGDVFWTIFALS